MSDKFIVKCLISSGDFLFREIKKRFNNNNNNAYVFLKPVMFHAEVSFLNRGDNYFVVDIA